MVKKRFINVRLDPFTRAMIKRLAEQKNTSSSQVIRELIKSEFMKPEEGGKHATVQTP